MRFLRLIFPTYFRRLRWEIAGWWLLSGSLSMLVLGGRELERLQGLSLAELMVALWMTLRLALIDDAFGTLAGRHWRPMKRREILAARLLLVLVVLLPPLLLRFIAWQYWAAPDAGRWREYLLESGAWPFYLLLAGVAIQLASMLNRWAFKRGRKAAAVVIAVLAGWFLMRMGLRPMLSGQSYQEDHMAASQRIEWDEAISGIRDLLPEDALLLGSWRRYGNPNSYPPMREMLRLPLREGRIAIEPGVEALIKKPQLAGPDLTFEVRLRCRDWQTAVKYARAFGIVHYQDGHYSDLEGGQGEISRSSVPLLPLQDLLIKRTAITPKVLPWRDAGKDTSTEGAELILYTRDERLPAVAVAPDPCIRIIRQGDPVKLPPISRKYGSRGGRDGNFDSYVVVPDEPWASAADKLRGCLMTLTDPQLGKQAEATALSLGRDAVPPILARPVWWSPAWEKIARPLLLAHVTADDRPILLERLKTQTRMSEILLAKGWASDALPILRTKLADGLPLDVDSLKILSGSKEPGLAADLKRAALLNEGSSEELDALLKEFPGFDWQGYVRESWRTMKRFRTRDTEITRLPAARAAREGDASAFRHVAELAVQEERGYEEELRKLVAGEPQGVVALVKENFAAMRFEPASGKWAVP